MIENGSTTSLLTSLVFFFFCLILLKQGFNFKEKKKKPVVYNGRHLSLNMNVKYLKPQLILWQPQEFVQLLLGIYSFLRETDLGKPQIKSRNNQTQGEDY